MSRVCVAVQGAVRAADLVIEIPAGGAAGGEGGDGAEGHYRLDYRPPDGTPPPNFTVPAKANTITFQVTHILTHYIYYKSSFKLQQFP